LCELLYEYLFSHNETNRIEVLKQNLTNIVKSIDTSALQENDIFYVHKNRADPNRYEIFT